MSDKFMVEKINGANGIYTNKYNAEAIKPIENSDVSIFTSSNNVSTMPTDVEVLYQELAEIQEKNGAILDGWNNFKETVGLGTSAKKCEKTIEKYQKGEISFEEAANEINKFDSKQQSSLNLFSNIATSIAAIGTVAGVVATVATGGLAAPVAIAIGAGAGALTKAGFKAADRASNDIKGDTMDGKQLAKDALGGAVTGGLASFSMGTAGTAQTLGEAVKGCTITGLKTGAISGSSNYAIDCAFDKDKEFDAGEFIRTTAENAIVSGTVGAIMGSANFNLHHSNILKSGCNLKSVEKGNIKINDVAANSVCTAEYKILNDRIKNIAA